MLRVSEVHQVDGLVDVALDIVDATHSQDTTLLDHLRFLTNAGFTSVDCFYKRLGHAVVGGYKR